MGAGPGACKGFMAIFKFAAKGFCIEDRIDCCWRRLARGQAENMRIGILGPIGTADVQHLLDLSDTASLSPGTPGAPFMGTLITAFLELGHEVVAFTSERTLDLDSRPRHVDGPGFRLWLCPSRPNGTLPRRGRIGRVWDFFRMERRRLAEAVASERVDILHAHWIYEYAMVAIRSGLPAIATVHDVPGEIMRFTPTPYTVGRYMMARQVLKSGIPITAVSGYAAASMASLVSRPITIVANPLPAWLRTLKKSRQLKDPTMADDSSPFIIAMVVGHWNRFKNPLPSILAFLELRKTLARTCELRLYGPDFGPGGKAERLLRAANLPLEGIKLRGRIEHRELLHEMQSASLLLHPSLTESFGMAVAEAMAIGIPIIAGRQSGGVPWLLDEGRAGQLVDVKDTKAICSAVERIFEHPVEIDAKCEVARNRVWQLADPYATAEQYLGVYRSVLA
jgi:glycosyltransferase involved in cell wall biosynthesis